MTLKILEVCTASSPAYALVYPRAHHLQKNYSEHIQIEILCDSGKEVGIMREQGIKVIESPLHRSLNPFKLLHSSWNLLQVLRKNNYDIVHLHFGVPSLIGRIIALFMKEPIWLYQSHGYSLSENTPPIPRFVYLSLERLLKNSVDLALFQSQEDISIAHRYHLLDEQQIYYLGNGINTERFKPEKLPSSMEPRTLFGMAARFETIKNHQLLLDAVKHLRLQRQDFKVLLIGQGPLKEVVQAQIDAHELREYIEILPYTTQNMPAFYRQIDVGMLTSLGEGLPRALLEPMACEKPVLCTDVKGSREAIVDNVTGFMVPLEQPEKLAERMRWYIEHPEQRQIMGRIARQHILKNYSEQDVLKKLADIYLSYKKTNMPKLEEVVTS